MRLALLRLLGAGAACFVVGCGSSSSQLSTEAADRMNRALAATRAAAEAHDSKKAIGALSSLSDIVRRESQEGRLSAAEERALRTAIAQARRRVALDVKSPPPQPTPPPTPTPVQSTPVPPVAPEEKRGQEKQDAEGDKDAEGDEENKDAKGDKREKAKEGNGKGGG